MNPNLRYVAAFHIAVGAPVESGAGCRMIPVLGGAVRGPSLNGTILAGGADWQQPAHAETVRISGRWILQTDDGVPIQVETPGIRRASPEITAALAAGRDIDPGLYYFRVTPQFVVTSERYAWLQQSLFVGLGAKQPKGVQIEVFALA
jgi:Protein of unknown function (DUF3237)